MITAHISRASVSATSRPKIARCIIDSMALAIRGNIMAQAQAQAQAQARAVRG
jgi:hypothetical protein